MSSLQKNKNVANKLWEKMKTDKTLSSGEFWENKNKRNKFISIIVVYATNFLKSVWPNSLNKLSRLPKSKIKKKKLLKFCESNSNFKKPIIAIFTRTPLRKIEKLVGTSTWVFVIQLWKGQIGSFIPNPKKSK